MPKFDVIIMNPPYSKNLHLDILENVIPCADKVINISPIFWLIDKFAKFKTKVAYNRYEETISKKLENLDVISAKESQVMFDGTQMSTDLGIYTIGKGRF